MSIKQTFNEEVTALYPAEDRPIAFPTWFWRGVIVKFNQTPTTAEELTLNIRFDGEDFEVSSVDPSTAPKLPIAHFFTVPIPIATNVFANVSYANTDRNDISVLFLGSYD